MRAWTSGVIPSLTYRATVPTDKRWVLVWQEDNDYWIYRFGPGLMSEPDDVQWTHWMPLPAPPVVK